LPHSDQLKKTNDNWLRELITLLFFASCDPAPENECLFSFSGPTQTLFRIAKERFPCKASGVPKHKCSDGGGCVWKRQRRRAILMTTDEARMTNEVEVVVAI